MKKLNRFICWAKDPPSSSADLCECSVCHETKPCTDAHHDWYSPNSIHKI